MNKKGTVLLLLASIYFITAGISYGIFSKQSKSVTLTSLTTVPTVTTEGKTLFNPSLPKTESCPLNGALYSKEQRAWWEKHRPLGVMIENHQDSRPQSGLSYADVIYEAVAEGGITRFLTVFYCQDANPIGPVRSARTYFLDFISEYADNPLYAHVGGANAAGPADALSQIDDYGWSSYNDLNQFSIGFPTFWRDYNRLGHEVATEHTMYSTTTKLWDLGKSRGLTNVDKDGNPWDKKFVPYSFKDEATDRPLNQTIHIEFWNGYSQYFVDWNYDKASNAYKRKNAGQPHLDKDTNKQLTAKNVVILYLKESNAHDGYENNIHLLYTTKGTGKAIFFMDGKQITGTWRKDGRTSRTLLFDSNGAGIKFDRGTIWFEILPTDGVVNVS